LRTASGCRATAATLPIWSATIRRLLTVLRRSSFSSAPGVLDRTFDFGFAQMPGHAAVGIMVMEATVHGWDLAKATGQDTTIDPTLATMLLEGASALDAVRNEEGNPFGFAVDVPVDASPADKLIAASGRQP
jgi:uncharacterized protein (TIGR03086 family)